MRTVTFGQYLRAWRESNNKSQQDIVAVCGLCSDRYYSDVECDRRPPPKYDILLNMILKLKLNPLEALRAAAYSVRYQKEIRKHRS